MNRDRRVLPAISPFSVRCLAVAQERATRLCMPIDIQPFVEFIRGTRAPRTASAYERTARAFLTVLGKPQECPTENDVERFPRQTHRIWLTTCGIHTKSRAGKHTCAGQVSKEAGCLEKRPDSGHPICKRVAQRPNVSHEGRTWATIRGSRE